MPTVQDNAICIRRLDWSETSQIVVLISEAHGKVSATAKGAKRQNPSAMARFSGGVDLLSLARVAMILKPKQAMANLIEWDLIDPFWHLRQNLRAHQLAMYAADLVHHLVQDHDPHPKTFSALKHLLEQLGESDRQAAELLVFHWALVGDLGYRPILDRDAASGGPLAEAASYGFSSEAGGLVADTKAPGLWRVRAETVDLLRGLAESGSCRQEPTESVERANRLMCVYLRSILDKQLPTMRYVLGEAD